MITLERNVVIYEGEDEEENVVALKGTYKNLKSISIGQPWNKTKFKPDYVGESEDYILLAWDDSYGVLYKRDCKYDI